MATFDVDPEDAVVDTAFHGTTKDVQSKQVRILLREAGDGMPNSYSGLYYPHATAKNVSVLKTALLLWDELQFIVPYGEFNLQSEKNDPLVDEAYELIGMPHVPTETEKKQFHEQLVELLTAPDSQQFLMQAVNTAGEQYEIYPQKFLGETRIRHCFT